MLDKLKGFLKSKTFWANLVAAILGVVTDGLTTIGLDPQWYAGLVGLMNLGLRYVTTVALNEK